MVFHDWVKMNDDGSDYPDDERSIQSEVAVIGIRGTPVDIKEAPTQDMNSCPSGEGVDQGDTDSSSEDPTTPKNSNSRVNKRRQRFLWIGLCGIVVLAAVIGVTLGLTLGNGSSETESSNQQAGSSEGGFDFSYPDSSDVDGPPSGAPDTERTPIPASEPTSSSISLPPTLPPNVQQFSVSPSMGSATPSTPMIPPALPSAFPTDVPSVATTSSARPSGIPSDVPSEAPSAEPTGTPTAPLAPVTNPPTVLFNSNSSTLTTFCVIADAPYTQDEAAALPNQLVTEMEGCEFLVHLGDLFVGDTYCNEKDYLVARDIMLESKIPTFVVLGDNEWNDCVRDRIDAGMEIWTRYFVDFQDNWNNTFALTRQPGYPTNFAFVHKRTLVVALNIVGGRIHNETEWDIRLSSEFEWTRQVMNLNLIELGTADGVVLIAHAKPTSDHRLFFSPFKDYVQNELRNQFPILYLHGDGHAWIYTPSYENQSSLLRIQHEGGTNEPVLKILADPALMGPSASNSFQYDRQIDRFGASPKPENQSDRKKK